MYFVGSTVRTGCLNVRLTPTSENRSRHLLTIAMGQKATSLRPPQSYQLKDQGSIRCGHLLHERSKSNDDFACSFTVVSDNIERPPGFFQIWRLSAQPVQPGLCIMTVAVIASAIAPST